MHAGIPTQVHMLAPMTQREEPVALSPLDPSFWHRPWQSCLRKLIQDGSQPMCFLTQVPQSWGLGRSGPVRGPGPPQTPTARPMASALTGKLPAKRQYLVLKPGPTPIPLGWQPCGLVATSCRPTLLPERTFSRHKKPHLRLCFLKN